MAFGARINPSAIAWPVLSARSFALRAFVVYCQR
jgi:hypothetical protein